MTRSGMAIDLDRCTGCEACVVACAVERPGVSIGDTDDGYNAVRPSSREEEA